MEFLQRLDDPSRWKIVRNVPVFCPHTRTVKGPDGKPHTLTVTKADLESALARLDYLKDSYRKVPKLTLGHTNLDPKASEKDQPDIVGWAPQWRLGEWEAGLPVIYIDEYYTPETYNEVTKYPFRSVEFYPNSKEITGVALLKRDPQLDLGAVAYTRIPNLCIHYLRGDSMADNANDPTGTPDPNAKPQAKPVMSDDPVWLYFLQQYKAAMASGANGQLPGAAPPVQMQRVEEAIQFLRQDVKRLTDSQATLQTRLGESQSQYRREKAKHVVTQLRNDGYLTFDAVKEIDRLAGLTDAQMVEREQEIRQNYQRAPVGGDFVPVATDVTAGHQGGAVEFGTKHEHMELAQQYMRDHPGCDWEDAKSYAMAGGAK